MYKLRTITVAVLSALATMSQIAVAGTGPSSSQSTYLVGQNGADFTSIITTGDSVGGYMMAGIPDGLGAYDNGNGTMTVLMNHELQGAGAVRAHGATGAFVSEWVINKSTLQVQSGQDLMQSANLWNGSAYTTTSGAWGSNTFARFCSADLASQSAFFNASSGLGTQNKLFLNGEEIGGGRAMAHVGSGADKGKSYELYTFGKQAWENSLANPYAQDKTIVISNSDGGNSGLTVWVGNKQSTGNDVEKAGLINGTRYTVQVTGGTTNNESRTTVQTTLGLNASNVGNFNLSTSTNSTFLRPEDGAWDTKDKNKYYFVTTDQMDAAKDGNLNTSTPAGQVGRSRLWSLTFNDIADPTLGGKIEMLLDGTEAHQMLDNMAVDKDGNIILQEDTGNNKHSAKVWKFDPTTKQLKLAGNHDVTRFGDVLTAPTAPYTVDEESSGVIDVTDLMAGTAGYDTVNNRYYLLDVQDHHAIPGTAVEGGQLLLMTAPVPEPAEYAMMLAGLAVVGGVVRRRRAIGA